LQGQEVLVCLQVRVALSHSQQPGEGPTECTLRFGLRSRALTDRLDCHVAGVRDRLQGLPLVRGVALNGLYQVGDEIMPSLQLYVNLRPGVPHLVAQPHEAVVREPQHKEHEGHDPEYDIECGHVKPPQPYSGPGFGWTAGSECESGCQVPA